MADGVEGKVSSMPLSFPWLQCITEGGTCKMALCRHFRVSTSLPPENAGRAAHHARIRGSLADLHLRLLFLQDSHGQRARPRSEMRRIMLPTGAGDLLFQMTLLLELLVSLCVLSWRICQLPWAFVLNLSITNVTRFFFKAMVCFWGEQCGWKIKRPGAWCEEIPRGQIFGSSF